MITNAITESALALMDTKETDEMEVVMETYTFSILILLSVNSLQTF